MKKKDYKIKINRVPKTYKLHPYTDMLLEIIATELNQDRTAIIEQLIWSLFSTGRGNLTWRKLQSRFLATLELNLPGPMDEEFLKRVDAIQQVEDAINRKKVA